MAEILPIPITDIEDFESVDVIEVLVNEGDEVTLDQPLITIESDKAMMDYPSPHAGIVEKVLVNNGSKITQGDILITLIIIDSLIPSVPNDSGPKNIENRHEENTDFVAKLNLSSNIKDASPIQSSQTYASPSAQKFARELGVNLNQVHGTGRNKRIVEEDIQQHVRTHMLNEITNQSRNVKPLNFSSYGSTSTKKLNKIQKLTADNMLNAWQSIPHVTHFEQADITQLEVQRKKLAVGLKERNIKLTPLAFVVKALVATLKIFPQFNTSLDTASEEIVYKDYYHIGIAVDTPHGLFVPVIRDADKKTLEQIAQELVLVGDLARQRKLSPKHMGGASMTISSLGNLGGQAFTPIINPPEVAILGLSKMTVKQNNIDDSIELEKLLPLSLSYDHRVINGADAAKFSAHLKSVLEDIWKLIL